MNHLVFATFPSFFQLTDGLFYLCHLSVSLGVGEADKDNKHAWSCGTYILVGEKDDRYG